MNRNFGIELEIAGITQARALAALQAVGVQACAEGYNHATRSHWKIVPDGSVREGFEVVSPVLQGQEGLNTALAPAQHRLVVALQSAQHSASALASLLNVQPHTLRAAITRLRQAGLAIGTSRRNGETFYTLEGSQTPQNSLVDSLWAGIDALLATFYRNRAAVLAL